MNQSEHARGSTLLEEAVTVLFCLVDDLYQNLNPKAQRYESLKKTLGLRGHNSRLVPATSGYGKPTLFPARCFEVLLASLPRSGRPRTLLIAPPFAQAEAFFRALEAERGHRTGRRPRNPDRRLDPAFGVAS